MAVRSRDANWFIAVTSHPLSMTTILLSLLRVRRRGNPDDLFSLQHLSRGPGRPRSGGRYLRAYSAADHSWPGGQHDHAAHTKSQPGASTGLTEPAARLAGRIRASFPARPTRHSMAPRFGSQWCLRTRPAHARATAVQSVSHLSPQCRLMMRFTTRSPVRGSVHLRLIFDSPSLAQ